MLMKTLGAAFCLAFFLTACGGDATETAAPAATEEEDHGHEHGPESHTHDMTADTAGTYADTSGAFFSEEDSTSASHEHGPDSHTH